MTIITMANTQGKKKPPQIKKNNAGKLTERYKEHFLCRKVRRAGVTMNNIAV